ncbi:MAG: DUF308 domain-containing protein [Tissierellia bacterium]|nr:DUF308 domain-containing protein [Tissierellia bacterium]
MSKKNVFLVSLIIVGILLLVVSTLLIVNDMFWSDAFVVLGYISLISGLSNIINYFKSRNKAYLIRFVLNIVGGLILIFYTRIPVRLLFIVFSAYIVGNGLIQFISYMLIAKGKVKVGFLVFLAVLIVILFGVSLFLGKVVTTRIFNIVLGIYGILLGITHIADGIYGLIPREKKDKMKRRIKVSPPNFVTAFIPLFVLEYINNKLSPSESKNQISYDKCVEVFIHVSKKGFGAIGHVDFSIGDKVYSYGNHDQESAKFLGAIGDGVLFIANKKDYVLYCIEDDNNAIFSYEVLLNNEQYDIVNENIEELMSTSYRWKPNLKDSSEGNYAKIIFDATNAEFYKFSSGKFKNYFVLGENCVKLVDGIIGSSSGSGAFNMNGIISPGAYQLYLEGEYQKGNTNIVSRVMYK